MRYQVPQFVDIQDRIIGPLTLKQFLYYVVAALLLLPVYALADLGLFLALAIPVVGVAALFAHVRWRGQNFAELLANLMKYFTGDRLYIWRRQANAADIRISGEEYEEFSAEGAAARSTLDFIAQTLNTQGNVIEQDAADPMTEKSKATAAEREPTNITPDQSPAS